MTCRRTAPLLVLAAAALLTVSACTSSSSTPEPSVATPSTATSAPAPSGADYVALGDSYSAGPGIQPADTEQPQCFRSEANWPNLLADAEGLDLADVSCSGATTESAIEGSGDELPSQLEDALASAATSADVPFVSMREASTGHDVCAGDDAWVNGAQVIGGDGIVFQASEVQILLPNEPNSSAERFAG